MNLPYREEAMAKRPEMQIDPATGAATEVRNPTSSAIAPGRSISMPVGDPTPAMEVRAGGAQDFAADHERLVASTNAMTFSVAALTAVAKRWMATHGPACSCALCTETREALKA